MKTRTTRPEAPPSTLRKVLTLALLALALGIAMFTVYFVKLTRTRLQHLHVPAVLNFRIEEILVVPEAPRTIEVMKGLPAELSCEVVPPDEPEARTSFRFEVDGQLVAEAADCKVLHTFDGPVGSRHEIGLEYLVEQPGRSPQSIGRRQGQVQVIAAEEQLRIVALETPEKKPIPTLTVPLRVVPYVQGALRLEGAASSYVALFFVDPEGAGRPVLQVSVPADAPQKFQVISSPLRRYRRFGPALTAFAAWPKEAIQVGNLEDERRMMELYVGIFRQADVERVADKFLRLEGIGSDGEVRLRVLDPGLAEIRALAYRGLISEPLRVVRALRAPSESRSIWRTVEPAKPDQ